MHPQKGLEKTMKKKTIMSLLLAAAMLASLAGCTKKENTEEPPAAEPAEEQAAQPAETVFENGGLKLTVPAEHADLVLVDVPQNDPDGVLFSVSEKASVEAGKLDNHDEDYGDGWLFGIRRVGEDGLHELLCWDMSGVEVFAKDAQGGYYLFTHPTDVRFYRQGDDFQDAAQWEDWGKLNEWASGVPAALIAENAGLAAYTRGNSMLDMYLARAAYLPDANYTLMTFTSDALAPNGTDAAPYVERLMNYASCEAADASETPAGAFIALDFPENEMRLDFFLSEGAENYIRQTDYNGESLLKLSFADDTRASAVVQEWFDAVAEANGVSPMLGRWAEKIAGRGLITIMGGENGTYNVVIDWSSSAFEKAFWEMTATAQEDGSLHYENGRHYIRTYTSETEYTDAEQYANGTGSFALNSANEIMWQDDVDHAGDDAVFISVD